MFKELIIPILADCQCETALTVARAIVGNGKIRLLGLVQANPGEPLSASAIQARIVRSTMQKLSNGAKVRSLGRVHVATDLVTELFSAVDQEKPDLLILEWPCHFEILETNLVSALRKSTRDLAIVRGPLEDPPKRVLAPIRGGPYAELALRIALGIARNTRAEITSLHVVQPDISKEQIAAFRGLSRIVDKIPEIEHLEIQSDNTAQAILEISAEYDLVILGATSQPVDSLIFTGPVAELVLRESQATVMIVKTSGPIPENSEIEYVGHRAISLLVDKWFAENTYHADEFSDLHELLALKESRGVTISLALPALNEQKTVGNVIQTVKTSLVDSIPILDEIVLMDSNSRDQTRQIATDLGVPVYIHQEVLPHYGARHGKGEALWKSLYTTRGDIVVWVDTDIVNIHPRFIYGLIGPLLVNPQLQFVKGFYRRPIRVGKRVQASGGGRVTELTARPLLNLFFPELSGLIQPLSGEYGGRRQALERLPFSSGYGVEIGLLIDLLQQFGLEAIAQVDLKERIHHNQPLAALSKMSFAIIQTVMRKLERRYQRDFIDEVNKTMKLIRYEPGRFFLDIEEIAEVERPPMFMLPEYRKLYAGSNHKELN